MANIDTRIAIIGTGFSGLGMAIQLKQAGIEDFVILERNPAVGGTWHDNHYPGCACDVPSHLYSFSFEPNPDWSRMFATQPEIRAYLEHCAERYNLHEKIRFNTYVIGSTWDEHTGTWRIKTAPSQEVADYMHRLDLQDHAKIDHNDPDLPEGETTTAQFLVAGIGGLSRPAFPTVPGLEDFRGESFHSAEWDHDVDLKGKRVAVIGTGASAIQFVPRIIDDVGELKLYQRTPPWILPHPDRKMRWAEKVLFKRVPQAQEALRNSIYWRWETQALAFVVNPLLMKLPELQARRHIRRQIKDKALRRKVIPNYTIGCKRILMSNEWYPALEREHTEVINEGVTQITENSVIGADGTEREVDVIIFGTGFHAQDPVPRGMVFGRDGIDINDAWPEGAEAYKGTTISGFPNMFFLMGPNTGLGHNSQLYMIESQLNYVMDCLRKMDRYHLHSIEVREDVQRDYNREIQFKLDGTVWHSGCQSWYINEYGRNTTLWPGFTWEFRMRTAKFDRGDYICKRAEPTEQAEHAA